MQEVTPQQTCEDILHLFTEVKVQVFLLAETQRLTGVQLFSLYLINRRGPLTMSQMAEILHCDASNVTGIVDRLIAQKMATRQALPQDRRTKILLLTPKGEEIIRTLERVLPSALKCDTLSEEERLVLHKVIHKLI